MRDAKEVKRLFAYANELVRKKDEYNSVQKIERDAGSNDCDKYQKTISANISFDVYMGYYGSSSVYQTMPRVDGILNKAISEYLTDNFDEIIEYASDYIKNDLKKDIKAIKEDIEKNQKLLEEIS